MRTSSADREGIRLMYHLFEYGVGHLADIFGMLPSSIGRIVHGRVNPEFTRDYIAKGKERDRKEVLVYIVKNGPCSAFDVELCLMLDRKAARRHLAALEGQHEIERCHFGGEKFRVIV